MGQVLKGMFAACVDAAIFGVKEALFLGAAGIIVFCQVDAIKKFVAEHAAPGNAASTVVLIHASSVEQQEQQQSAGGAQDSTRSLRGNPLRPLQSHSNQSDTAASANAALQAQKALAARLARETKALEEKKRKSLLENDRKVAEKLAAEFDKESKDLAERQMMKSQDGKAWKFVHAVIDLHKSMEQTIMQASQSSNTGVTTVAVDDLVWLARRMMKKQEVFTSTSIPAMVDLGFHWTQPENMKMIKTDGLLSKRERTERQIQAKHNGSAYGDGIYTSDYHTSHRHGGYGPICLLVARLKGTTSSVATDHQATCVNSTNTIVVLRSSDQCVPLLQFTNDLIADTYMLQYQMKVQAIIDSFFNDGVGGLKMPASTVPVVAMPQNRMIAQPAAAAPNPLIRAHRPLSAAPAVNIQPLGVASSRAAQIRTTSRYVAPRVLGGNSATGIQPVPAQAVVSTNDCAICFLSLKNQDAGRIVKCGHEFHDTCLQQAIAHSSKCPLCKKNITDPQGMMPDGSMLIQTKSNVACGGYPLDGTIEIHYNVSSGIQKQYHP